jgi:hypothetical protein
MGVRLGLEMCIVFIFISKGEQYVIWISFHHVIGTISVSTCAIKNKYMPRIMFEGLYVNKCYQDFSNMLLIHTTCHAWQKKLKVINPIQRGVFFLRIKLGRGGIYAPPPPMLYRVNSGHLKGDPKKT